MKIFAHRGASLDAPENTLMAFRLGWGQGADGAELDVHLSRDGRVMVCHDVDTARMAGHRLVVSQTNACVLRQLDVGGGHGDRAVMPYLDEVVAELPPTKGLLVEIKCGLEVIPALTALKLPAASIGFLCFDADVLAAAKRAMPGHLCLWNVEPPWNRGRGHYERFVARCRDCAFDGVSLGWYRGYIPGHVGFLHDAGLAVATWTVDDPAAAHAARSCGVDLLMTNTPGLIRAALGTT